MPSRDRGRQSQVGFPLRAAELNLLEEVLSVATLCESGIAEHAIDKQAQKVSGKNLTVIDDEGETEQTNTGGNQGGGNTPGGELEG